MLESNSSYSKFIAQLRNTAFHLGIGLDFLDSETIHLKNSYGFDFGKIVLNMEPLADSAKMKAENLLFMNHDKVELWQNGELLEYADFDSFHSNERTQKSIENKFLSRTFPKFDKEAKAFFLLAKKNIQHHKEEFQQNPPTNQEFHKVVGKLLSYFRKYLNPQANRNDVVELASFHAVLKLILQFHPNYEKLLPEKWIFKQFELVSEVFSFEELKTHSFLSFLKNGSFQFLRAVLQDFQSSTKFSHQIVNFAELDSLNKVANPIDKGFEHRNVLYINSQNATSENGKSSRFSPLLSDYYLSLLQERNSFWLNSFAVSQMNEVEKSLFNSNDFEQNISHKLSQQFQLIVGDFRTPTQEKFERGYQQVSEKLEGEIKGVFGEIPTKIAKKNWMKWLISSLQKLENEGSICFFAPLDLAESENCLSVRLRLVGMFGGIQITKYISAPKPYAVYKFSNFKKVFDGVGEGFAGYSNQMNMMIQNIDNQFVESSDLQFGLNSKTWLDQSESSYFDQIPLLKSKQNAFGFYLFEEKKVDGKLPSIIFQKNTTDYYFVWSEIQKQATYKFQKLTPKAIAYFRKFYGEQLAIPQFLATEILIEQLQEISRFSKQLPVLEKLSVRLSQRLSENQSTKTRLSDAVDILQEIESYAEKIKQLAKGANERKTTFAIMQQHLQNMKSEIKQQLESEKKLSEKLEAVEEGNILSYIYAVLQNPITQERYSRIHQEYLPRVALFTDFWTWSELGKELVESLQSLNPTEEEFGIWENEENSEIQKLTFDIKRRKMFSDGELILGEIPEEVFLPKLGKTLLVKHLLKRNNHSLSKYEINKIFQICLNYWQVLEKIRIFSEGSIPFYFDYNEQIP